MKTIFGTVGIIYDHSVGCDSYTNWFYSIGLNGGDEDSGNYHFSKVLEMVRAGANLTIEGQDEYCFRILSGNSVTALCKKIHDVSITGLEFCILTACNMK